MRISNEFLKMKLNKFDQLISRIEVRIQIMFDNYCINNKNDKYIFLRLF